MRCIVPTDKCFQNIIKTSKYRTTERTERENNLFNTYEFFKLIIITTLIHLGLINDYYYDYVFFVFFLLAVVFLSFCAKIHAHPIINNY